MLKLNECVGRLLNVTFLEGNVPNYKKGKLISVDDDFIELRTYSSTFLIKRSAIISLKIFEDDKGGGR